MNKVFDQIFRKTRLKVIIGVTGLSMAVQTLLKYIPDYGPLFSFIIGVVLATYGLKGD